MMTKARVVRIGNSQGIRLSKSVLEVSRLPEDVEIHAEPGRIMVTAARGARSGWAEAAESMRARDEDRLIDEPTPSEFDDHEWQW
jgi:antitoxin MazE